MQAVYWVVPNLLGGRCGPQKIPWDLTAFYNSGVRILISLADVELTPAETQRAGLVLYEAFLPMSTLESPKERIQVLLKLRPVLQVIRQAVIDDQGVVTHCRQGVDRTGLLLACALMDLERISAEDAVERVQAANPESLKVNGYIKAVQDFEQLWDPEKKRLAIPGFTRGLTNFIPKKS